MTLLELFARRKRLGTAPCVIVELTADARPQEKQRGLEAGMDNCVFKPVSLRNLSARATVIPPLLTPTPDQGRQIQCGYTADLHGFDLPFRQI